MFRENKTFTTFAHKIWLATPTMHEEEQQYIKEAFDQNWVTTAGENVNALEQAAASYLSSSGLYAAALSSGTAAIHLALKLAGLKINPAARYTQGLLQGQKVFVSDLTFNATVNPIVYEGGEPVFIDSEYETWNMDPEALEKAFSLYPDVKVVVVANLYGTPAKLTRIREICDEHGAVLIEDAAESLGAYISVDGQKRQTGTFGDYNVISFNGNKIITGSSGGMLLSADKEAVEKVKKWSTQAREAAPWYQHEELGYNYRISNIIAGIARGQMKHLDEHIQRKRKVYDRYKEGLSGLPVVMNPCEDDAVPNCWLSCILIDREKMARQVRSDQDAMYERVEGKSTPTEILETMARYNAEGRPIWKPMHMQPIYRVHGFVTAKGSGRAKSDAYISHEFSAVSEDIFERGLCLPSDIKMTEEEQNQVIEMIRACFE